MEKWDTGKLLPAEGIFCGERARIQLFRGRHRLGSEEQGVGDREDGAIGGDGGRERRHGHHREAGIGAQHAGAVADVLGDRFDPCAGALFAHLLRDGVGAPKLDGGGPPRLFGRQPALDFLVDEEVENGVDLAIEITINRITVPQVAPQTPQSTHHRHHL